MPNKEEAKERKRMVVEEVGKEVVATGEPEILDEAAKDTVSIQPEEESAPESKHKPMADEPCKEVRPLDTPNDSKKSPSIALWIIIPGIFLLGALLGGIVFYQKGVNKNTTEIPTSVSESTPTPVASASPSASVELTKYTINIFNGSGIAGEAGRAKTLITDEGFKAGTTANAATYDYTKTIIKAKSTVEAEFINALSKALGKLYSVDTPQTLSTTSADSVQVIVGSSKAN